MKSLLLLTTVLLCSCATSVTQEAAPVPAEFVRPSSGLLPVSFSGRWMSGTGLFLIDSPEGGIALKMSDETPSGTITFPGAPPFTLPHMDETLAVASEQPEVESWFSADGSLMVAISAAYTMETSQGIYSFRDGNLTRYFTETKSSDVSNSGGPQKIVRKFRFADGSEAHGF